MKKISGYALLLGTLMSQGSVYGSQEIESHDPQRPSRVPCLNLGALSQGPSTSSEELTEEESNEEERRESFFAAILKAYENNLIFRGSRLEKVSRALDYFRGEHEETHPDALWLADELLRSPCDLLESFESQYQKLAHAPLKKNVHILCSPRENRAEKAHMTFEMLTNFRAFYMTHQEAMTPLFEAVYEKESPEYLLKLVGMWRSLSHLSDLGEKFKALEEKDRFYLTLEETCDASASEKKKKVKKKTKNEKRCENEKPRDITGHRPRSKTALRLLPDATSGEDIGSSPFDERNSTRRGSLEKADPSIYENASSRGEEKGATPRPSRKKNDKISREENASPSNSDGEKKIKTPRGALMRAWSRVSKSGRHLKDDSSSGLGDGEI